MSVETYNGWTNRETWALALWINNGQGWHDEIRELVAQAVCEHDEQQREGCTDCVQGSHSADCGTDLETLTDYRAWQAGDIIRESVEGLLDPDAYADEYGQPQPVEIARMSYDIGSLYRVDWAEVGESFLCDLAESAYAS